MTRKKKTTPNPAELLQRNIPLKVLPPEQLAGQLLAYLQYPYTQSPASLASLGPPGVDCRRLLIVNCRRLLIAVGC